MDLVLGQVEVVGSLGVPGPQGPQGPTGPTGGNQYVHVQSSALVTWTVNHNLGHYPDVTILSVGGIEVVAGIAHQSLNQFLVTFASAQSGQAIAV